MTKIGEELVTYKMADGSQIYGEFDWVTDLEFFDGADEPCDVIKETWQLVTSETITYGPVEDDDEDDDEVPS